MKITRPDLAALAVCALAVVGIVLLTALRVSYPEVLSTIALISLSAGVGIATQPVITTGTPQAASEPVTAPAPTPAPYIPAQASAPAAAPSAASLR